MANQNVTGLPFVHVFSPPGGHYVFDVNTRTVIRVSYPLSKLLASLEHRRHPEASNPRGPHRPAARRNEGSFSGICLHGRHRFHVIETSDVNLPSSSGHSA